MGFTTYNVNGYGVMTEHMKPDGETLLRSVVTYKPSLLQAMGIDNLVDLDAEEFVETFNDEYIDDEGIESGYFGFLCDVVARETGIRLDYVTGEWKNGVMFTDRQPWNYTEQEKKLTSLQLKALFTKWFKRVLNIPVLANDMDYISVGIMG